MLEKQFERYSINQRTPKYCVSLRDFALHFERMRTFPECCLLTANPRRRCPNFKGVCCIKGKSIHMRCLNE